MDGAEVRRVLADMAQLEPNGLRDFVATHGDFDLLRLRWVDDHHLRQHLERALEGALGRYQVLRRRPPRMRAAGARPFEAPIDGPVHPPARAKEPSLRTIELEHIYHDDDPLQAADFAVRLSDGSLRRGALNRRGQAVVPDVPDGDAQVQFGSDARLWELVSKDRNPAEQPDLSLAQIDALIAQQARNQ